jgi:hypothetical protein
MFDPQTRGQANQKPRVLICDGFGTHKTLKALEFCFKNNIILCCLPSHTSHKLQPYNVGVFAPLKAAYHNKADGLFQGGTNIVGKQHFTSLYSPVREKVFTKRNIMAAWAACGLFPFNPDRVLRVIPKSPAQLTIPRADKIKVGSCHQDEVPQTPVMPVSAEGLALLHNLIKQDAHTLNETSLQRLERHVQKLANAAQISFAERALLHDQNQMLTRMNNEAKVRRSTRSVVLGKAKEMSFEDIEVVRAARAAKEVIKGKGKRGRKRKSAALEADEPEPEPEVARMTEVPEPWRAPGGAGDLKRRLRRIDCCKRNRKSLLCSVEVGVCILSWSADSARLSFFPLVPFLVEVSQPYPEIRQALCVRS